MEKKQKKLNQISGAGRQERVEMLKNVAFFLCSQEGEFCAMHLYDYMTLILFTQFEGFYSVFLLYFIELNGAE